MNARSRLFTVALLVMAPVLAHATDVGVLIRFGLKDDKPNTWDGSLALSSGKVATIEGWRFEDADAVTGADSWKAGTRALTQRKARGNNPQKLGMKKQQQQDAANEPMSDNGIIAQLTNVSADTQVSVKTSQGEFAFKLADLKLGEPVRQLDGSVAIERVSATAALTGDDNNDDDFPAIAVDKNGDTWIAYTSFTPGMDRGVRAKGFETEPASFDELAKPTGGDQIWLRHRKAGEDKWDKPVAVADAGGDVMRCALAPDASGGVHVVWSQRLDDQFKIFHERMVGGKLGEVEFLSKGGGNAFSPVVATNTNGEFWFVWQQESAGVFRIMAAHTTKDGTAPTQPVVVSEGLTRNCWSPAITASKDGKIAIGWDSYEKGDYDVYVREYDASGKAGEVRVAANSPNYESRPSITYDTKGRLWIAYEQSGAKWGKDWGAYDKEDGIGLYKERRIGLRVLEDGVWKEPAQNHNTVLPGRITKGGWDGLKWSQQNNAQSVNGGGFAGDEKKPGKRNQGQGAQVRAKGEEAAAAGLQVFNNLARICADDAGRVWLLCRTKQGQFHTPIGSVWYDYACCYDGDAWHGPILIPHTDNLLFNQPAITALPNGIRLAHSTDHRQDRLTVWKKNRILAGGKTGNAALGSTVDPFVNDIYVSDITLDGEAKPLVLNDAKNKPNADAKPADYTVKELADVKSVRDYRMKMEGTELRILRGEFHRHTEISGDGGGDGPLEDMWRYALDVASMDWLGCGDHDNGGGREYTWWLTQKTTDAYHIPGRFDPLFTYERSVSYPEGHRNVIFTQRGIRTLPRLPISDAFDSKPAPDTQMLYKYLHHFNGICASHTSATSMGTDWRDNDPVVEPFVEIYQGARQNYERPGAPRCPTKDDSIGGWEPKGFVNLALQKGYRLAFESSSDHGSTHISYACVYAKEPSRQGIFDAMKLRHTYAATDNIIADVQSKAGGKMQMMGDEFTSKETPNLIVKLVGTQPFKKVTIVKDDEEVQVMKPNAKEVSFTWKDPKPEAGKTSYYYVRGEQTDTELVWASPMWIKYAP